MPPRNRRIAGDRGSPGNRGKPTRDREMTRYRGKLFSFNHFLEGEENRDSPVPRIHEILRELGLSGCMPAHLPDAAQIQTCPHQYSSGSVGTVN